MSVRISFTPNELEQLISMSAYVLEAPCLEWLETKEEFDAVGLEAAQRALAKLRAAQAKQAVTHVSE